MYCSKCGSQIPDETKFCPACGHPIDIRRNVQSTEYLQLDLWRVPTTKEEADALLEEILSSLSTEEQMVIRLHYDKGYTPQQIAEELGISEAEANEHLKYAQDNSRFKIMDMDKHSTRLYELTPDVQIHKLEPLEYLAALFDVCSGKGKGNVKEPTHPSRKRIAFPWKKKSPH